MVIAVLAVQGSFFEHEQILEKLGVEYFEIRRKADLDKHFDGLILPGGESTTMGKLLKELDIFDTLQKKIADGLPVYGTCAGMILLANNLSNDKNVYFGTMDITVKRNAYGRQLGSFRTVAELKGVGEVPMTFIRAPYVAETGDGVEVLATVDGKIVGVQYKNQMAFAFHPELDNDTRIHEKFAAMVRDK